MRMPAKWSTAARRLHDAAREECGQDMATYALPIALITTGVTVSTQ